MTNTLSRKHRVELAQGAMQDGIDDYCAGVPVQLCPYQRRTYRRAWLKGWHQMDRQATKALALRDDMQYLTSQIAHDMAYGRLILAA